MLTERTWYLGTQKKGGTYECIEEKTEEKIVQDHKKYMVKHDIPLSSNQEALPFLYWIPKMHKNPSEQR